MDIIISDNWLREYLETKATPKQIAEFVSLCGPSVEKLEEKDGDVLYHVEITTNRIDCAGVYGFAREVSAILPRFGISAKLKPLSPNIHVQSIDNLSFTIIGNNKLVKRSMGVVLTDIKNWKTPSWMKQRLISCGVRSLNAVVDITNYVMLETGHPSHAFDYDKIKNKKFVIRESKKGEKVTSFDEKTYTLLGGDIIFDDGDGEIIDLPGIIGTKNSVVDPKTNRVFFFIDNNDPAHIRRSSMTHAIRTMAATINEKGVDPELSKIAMYRGIELFTKICKAEISSKVFDNYDSPYKTKTILINKDFIDKSLGIEISKEEIEKYLTSLCFKPKWTKNNLSVMVPSFRSDDINIPEDIVEEIARIYGYHNLPSNLMSGKLPNQTYRTNIPMEFTIKNILKALGGYEIYTLSLVPNNYVSNDGLRLKNPMGSDTEYLRTDLSHSLIEAVKNNTGNYERLFLFELANIYIPNGNDLPSEKMTLGLIMDGYKYYEVKGILETLITTELHAEFHIQKTEMTNILNIVSNGSEIGYINLKDDGLIIAEIDVEKMLKNAKEFSSFVKIPKHPPQIEDLTIKLKHGVEVGKVIECIKTCFDVSGVELIDVYNNSYTFRIFYQDMDRTLSDVDVKKIREDITSKLIAQYKVEI